ncbi:ABC transporter permease subunit [Mesorhizobium sp. M3A.F.Ca.ET.201.01.1.1]|uniref:ABC transporter permease subunit n=1 Tax=Mesorhizobium sp. M3A.F.Ca.ET.201.01.1.1 TaxID=2563946 RepID=UPI001093B391|nr:ABC transporter permease subunit [Mesorhizobium sp. M3A.F.Ca.ET.201.01.1.1]TGS71761.1 ABC transporter permease subunit [Mesorhizobium sp. M3A.F.Ca.ET.201.01.1.1]
MASAFSATDRRRAGQYFVSNAAIYGWILVLVAAPNVFLLAASFLSAKGGSIRFDLTLLNYTRLFERPTYPFLLLKTVLMAGSAALLATLVSVPMALYTSRHVRAKAAVILLFVVPLWISLLMRVFAWKIILGEAGILNSLLISSGITDTPFSSLIYNPFVAVFVMTNVVLPYVFVSAFVAVDRIPQAYVQASRDVGAGAFYTFLKVVWPLARPGIFVGTALAFLIAVGDYVTPSMVGGLDGTTIGMLIASQFGFAGNWPFGSAIAVLLIGTVVALLAVCFALTRTRGTFEPQVGYMPADSERRSMRARFGALAARILFAVPIVLLYLPLLVMASFSVNDSPAQSFPFSGFTVRWYADAMHNTQLLAAALRSIMVGGLAVIFGTIVGTLFALAFARKQVFAGAFAQTLFALPVALPGIILGISLALVFRSVDVTSSTLKIVIGHMTFVTPVIALTILGRLNTLDRNLDHAAADLGSSALQALRYVTLPILRPAILGGAVLGFTLSFDEVLVSLFLSATDPTLPIYIWNQLRFGFTPEINAAFTLIAAVSIAGIAAAFIWLGLGRSPGAVVSNHGIGD